MSDDERKARARDRFGQFASAYVQSDVHSGGPDLERLLAVADPRPAWMVLDVATGGGHTALKFAPRAARVIATDIGLTMLNAAREFIQDAGAGNVRFAGADAENLPFATAAFDMVTCRVAAHHFPDVYRFVLEAARVLKPGGYLAIQDHLLPDDPRAAAYIEAFDRLRDPSHVRAFDEYGWRGLLLDADLTVEHVEKLERPALFVPWADRQGCDAATRERLRILLAQAPPAVAEWIHPRHVLSPDAGFDHVYILITGRKRSQDG